ncbi:ribonuclease P [Lentimicrobium saccharophilum]|uniref:Ribonuclease P protein component n=1 Tax=Lentimicrobium saccharophilum TaxID=1678841 RepID=A0A0S7C7K3_9BACT|nr:ribonuclease P protein component [Lentimicrobium saccharophilum]GAP45219.1 ribonuclease P [Lentimicrobium saccharophilum]
MAVAMQTFRKNERLCSATEIDRLFREGKTLFRHPLKLIWLPAAWEGPPVVKVIISVPKRNFRHAVSRNRIRRMIRECYRKNKWILSEGLGDQKCTLGLVFSGKEIPQYIKLEPIIIQLFRRLIQEHEKAAG